MCVSSLRIMLPTFPTFLTLRDTRTGTGFPAPVVFHSRVKRLGTEFFDLRREFRLQLFQLLQGFLLFLEIGLKQLGGIVLPERLGLIDQSLVRDNLVMLGFHGARGDHTVEDLWRGLFLDGV